MEYMHISRLPKSQRPAARKAGKTHYECKWCGIKAAHGEVKPLFSSEGYAHQWVELCEADCEELRHRDAVLHKARR